MNIFGFITIGLVLTAVLLIYYVELPRLRREVKNQGWYLEHTEKTISRLISDVEMIKSARGTFSRQLAELDSLVHSIGDKVDLFADVCAPHGLRLAVLESKVFHRKVEKKKKSGK
jgi:hypothetical protein